MAFTDGYLILIPGIFVVLPAVPVAVWIVRRGADERWTLFSMLALMHLTAVVALTIFPIPIGGQDFYRHTRGMSGDNVVPFATIVSQIGDLRSGVLTWSALRQLTGNFLLLTPLGVYGPELWPALRDWRRFVVVAIAFGVGLELAQYAGSVIEAFSYRIMDVDDAIMNAAGAVAAFFVWRWLSHGRLAAILAAHGLESPSWLPKP